MARAKVEPAVRDLLQQSADGQECTSTVSLGGDGFTLYGHIRVLHTAPARAEVSVACWVANMDMARFHGGNPPTEAETRLPPEGTARPDDSFTARVVDHLATLMNALDTPQAGDDGHLTITVPLAPSAASRQAAGSTR